MSVDSPWNLGPLVNSDVTRELAVGSSRTSTTSVMHEQPLHVPTVTAHDLATFHHSHLCQIPDCTSYLCSATDGLPADEEQDCLGYYPDGVKRTLTDAQVAMFRFSEIQQLLKQKRREEAKRKRKRNDADDEAIDPSEIPRPAPVSPEDARQNRLQAALWASKHDWDEFGNPVDASVPQEYVAEVQGNAETGKTFLWPKIVRDKDE